MPPTQRVILTLPTSAGGAFSPNFSAPCRWCRKKDRQSVAGFLINRFRGDLNLFDDGIVYLEKEGKRPVFGVIPHYNHIDIDPEDSQSLDTLTDPPSQPRPDRVAIAVIRLPRISNFTDFSPLQRDTGVDLHYLTRPRDLQGYDLVILPGSKNVRADREWLSHNGWEKHLTQYAEAGGSIGGICGGYQILGRIIRDPLGIEGLPGESAGLGLLDVETVLTDEKELIRVKGTWAALDQPVEGYEIHMGRTCCPAGSEAIRKKDGTTDGLRSPNGRFWGVYLHGLFDNPSFRHAFLANLNPAYRPALDYKTTLKFKDRQYGLLAGHFRQHLDLDRLLATTGLKEVFRGS